MGTSGYPTRLYELGMSAIRLAPGPPPNGQIGIGISICIDGTAWGGKHSLQERDIDVLFIVC